jgi:hypothetical protein
MHPCDNAEALLRLLSPARRNHFFYGKRMDVQHFQMEQDYGKLKQWMLNRLTLGKGVICGLKVSIVGERFCVDPGVAIDGLGREIVVPVRQCIDPTTNDGGCCVPCCDDAQPTPAREPTDRPDSSVPGPDPATHPGHEPTDDADDREDPRRLYTLWLCYKECKTDFQPVLVSECQVRQPCAAGTIVESFCLKVAPGAPLQQDPDWCAHLWPRRQQPGDPPPPGHEHLPSASDFTAEPSTPANVSSSDSLTATPDPTHPDPPKPEDIQDSLDSRRRILCMLFGETCDVDEGDPCVPLGLFRMRGKTITHFDACLVRPRIYSNARLLDLILCLADKIDECCNHEQPPPPVPAVPMRLQKVDFLNRLTSGTEALIATMVNPLVDTMIDIERGVNTIRIVFTQAFAQNQRKPTTPGVNDPDFKRHNVQILPDDILSNVPYVAGTLTIENASTVRFDLARESPYFRQQGAGGWQKGRYRVFLRGNENLPSGQPALGNASGAAFDGEPIAPASGVISGDNTAGGDFIGAFVIGGRTQPDTLRVRDIQFLNRDGNDGESVIASITSPLQNTPIASGFASIRIRFTGPLVARGAARPTTHGLNDADFRHHNVQVLVTEGNAATHGAEFLPGRLVIEAPDTLRFDVVRGSAIVDAQGDWPPGRTRYRILLRGTAQAGRPALAQTGGGSLDGEPIAPTGGVISGSGAAGGDFTADFSVVTPT